LITPEWVADKYTRWGRSSPMYQSRVLAEFPQQGTDTLIPLAWIEAAFERQLDNKGLHVLGVDFGLGSDKTVIVERIGNHAKIYFAAQIPDSMESCGKVSRAITDTKATIAAVDSCGIGKPIADRLKEMTLPIQFVNAAESATENEFYANVRAEMYWMLRERFERGEISIEPNEDLISQLSSIKYKTNSRGQILIESKDDMKKRGMSSPDESDALAIAFYCRIQSFSCNSGFDDLECVPKWRV